MAFSVYTRVIIAWDQNTGIKPNKEADAIPEIIDESRGLAMELFCSG